MADEDCEIRCDCGHLDDAHTDMMSGQAPFRSCQFCSCPQFTVEGVAVVSLIHHRHVTWNSALSAAISALRANREARVKLDPVTVLESLLRQPH